MEVREGSASPSQSGMGFPYSNAIPGLRGFSGNYLIIMERNQDIGIRDAKVRIGLLNSLHSILEHPQLIVGSHRRFYCWGPSKPPMYMTANEAVDWNAHLQTPVIYNHHEPLVVNASTIKHVDLNPIKSTPQAVSNEERVLILTPLRDAAFYLPKYFDLLSELTYPHHLIDLGFLVGDSTDDTIAVLSAEVNRIQEGENTTPFNSVLIIEKDFGAITSQDVQDRHGFEVQADRRKLMARARNYLLYTALKPEHSWVYWRDVDIVDSPTKILEDFIAHDRDILVPSMSAVHV